MLNTHAQKEQHCYVAECAFQKEQHSFYAEQQKEPHSFDAEHACTERTTQLPYDAERAHGEITIQL